MLIYANKHDSGWITQTPAQGAVPFDSGTPLPFESPPGGAEWPESSSLTPAGSSGFAAAPGPDRRVEAE
jgi:hypothetical protein